MTWVQLNNEIIVDVELVEWPPVLDWEGVTDNDGNEIPYSKEKASEMMRNNPDFCHSILLSLARIEIQK